MMEASFSKSLTCKPVRFNAKCPVWWVRTQQQTQSIWDTIVWVGRNAAVYASARTENMQLVNVRFPLQHEVN